MTDPGVMIEHAISHLWPGIANPAVWDACRLLRHAYWQIVGLPTEESYREYAKSKR